MSAVGAFMVVFAFVAGMLYLATGLALPVFEPELFWSAWVGSGALFVVMGTS